MINIFKSMFLFMVALLFGYAGAQGGPNIYGFPGLMYIAAIGFFIHCKFFDPRLRSIGIAEPIRHKMRLSIFIRFHGTARINFINTINFTSRLNACSRAVCHLRKHTFVTTKLHFYHLDASQ